MAEYKKFDYIDSLRGIAILMVLLVHCGGQGSSMIFFPHSISKLIDNGQLGVQLFFLVSAFTLMLSHENRKKELHSTFNFFTRRFFRIAPMYYFAILYYTFQDFIGFDYLTTGKMLQDISYGKLLSNVFFIHSINPNWINSYVPGGWSIAVEMVFYLTLPLILKYVTNVNRSFYFVIITLFFSQALNFFLKGSFLDVNFYLYIYFPSQLPIFALGIFAFYLIKNDKNTGFFTSVNILLLSVLVFIYSYLTIPYHISYSLIFFFLLISLSLKPYRLMVNPFLVNIGKISYSIYLVHFAILYWMHRLNFEFINVVSLNTALCDLLIRYIVLLLLSAFISYFTYKYIEIPGQGIGRNIINNKYFFNAFQRLSKS